MDRRTYKFVVASAAFLFFYLSLRTMFAPPPQPPKPDGAAEVQNLAEDLAADLAADESDAAADSSDTTDENTEDESEEGVASTKADPKWFSMGSMAPSDGFDHLITFSNQGGAIVRVELTSRNANGKFSYRRVDTTTGYVGYFAATPAEKIDGAKVNIVGRGTPAALASCSLAQGGIQVGDVILAVGQTPVQTDQDIEAALAKSKPGQTIKLEIARGDNANAQASPLIYEATLTEHPLDLVRLARDGGVDQIKGNLSRMSCLMTLARAGGKGIVAGQRFIKAIGDPEKQPWVGSQENGADGSQSVRFETTIGTKAMAAIGGQPVRLERTFTSKPGSYVVDMDVKVTNLSEAPQKLSYRLEGPNGITAEGWWYSNKISPHWSGAAARDVVYKSGADGHELISGNELLKRSKKTPEEAFQGIFAEDSPEAARALNYIGVDAQYFAAAYMAPEGQSVIQNFGRATTGIVADAEKIESSKGRAVNVSFFLDSKAINVPAAGSIQHSLRFYAGPKEPELLEKYGLGEFVYYGWFAPFSYILSSLLHILQNIVGNYGISIILLTVIVRGCMFPLSRNAAVNAQRMQELAPEMKKIAEKYKDDMEGRLKAQQALQKKVGFNPLSGCLPMFLQLPIFMGLYRALSVDIDLRQKPFFSDNGWASNLAAPDQFLHWGDWMWSYMGERGAGWLGPYFNILPLFVVVLFLTQQKLFMPPATDEQTAMTQKMMNFMTLFMGLFFFRVPAGLCIYFISSSIWGIGERIFVKKTLPKGKHFDLEDGDVIDAVSAGPKEPEKLTMAERLMEKVNQKTPQPPAEPPNKRKRPPGGKNKPGGKKRK